MNRLNLIYGASGAGMLRLVLSDLSRVESVVEFPSVLQCASLFQDFSTSSIVEYVEQYAQMHVMDSAASRNMYETITYFFKTDFSAYDDIVLWCGDAAGDRLFYYMCCALIPYPLHRVDISALRNMLPNPNGCGALSMAVCSADNIKSMLDHIYPLTDEDVLLGQNEWLRWSKSQSRIRILNGEGEMVAVEENYFDPFIIANCSDVWQGAARVIATILIEIEFAVGEGFLHRRIIHLAQEGSIKVRPNAKFFQDGVCTVEQCAQPVVAYGVDMSQLRLFELMV